MLEQSVVSAKCDEFKRLVLGLVREAEKGTQDEIKTAAQKVVKELSHKFKDFPKILLEMQPQACELLSPGLRPKEYSQRMLVKSRSHGEDVKQPVHNLKQASIVESDTNRLEFGFIPFKTMQKIE